MVSRTLFFGNPAYLHLNNGTIEIEMRNHNQEIEFPGGFYRSTTNRVSLDDIGLVILDNPGLIISQALLSELAVRNIAVMTCDTRHHPAGMIYPLEANTLQQARHQDQVNATEPLKKQLWQQIIKAKIRNQATLIQNLNLDPGDLFHFSDAVQSGDTGNLEARAAALYWKKIFVPYLNFSRNPQGEAPNNLLNYGYAILRAIIARAICAAGLFPALGIHHRNRYNAFCLADDLIEPFRPFVDGLVREWIEAGGELQELTLESKKHLLSIPTVDVRFHGKTSPLMVAAHLSAQSLQQCYEGKKRKLSLPEWTPGD